MIVEQGVVVAVEGRVAWVETRRKAACGGCQEHSGCGVAALDRWMGTRDTVVRALNDQSVNVGDSVRIGLDEKALLIGSALIYLVPLAGLLVGGLIVQWWFQPSSELALIGGSAAGFVAALVFARGFAARLTEDSRFQPVILRGGE